MRLTFLGANRQVTGSCYLLETGGLRLVIDCGMFQEREFLERNWQPKPLDAASLDAVLLTHAHLDHVGLLPRLVQDGFRGPMFATAPTVELATLVLRDSAHIQEEDAAFKARRHGREGRRGRHPEVPLYTAEDVEQVVPLLRPVGYREPLPLNEHVTVRYLEAGHILGASILELTVHESGVDRRIVFSGDLGQWDVPIVPDPAFVDAADCVVLESTYGDEDHERGRAVEDALAEAVTDTVHRGGNLLIPTFAIERAQELLLHLAELVRTKRIPRLRMYLDSPMAADATEIYLRHPEFMDDRARATFGGRRLDAARHLLEFVRTAEASKALNAIRGTCIILAGSGMCTGGRIKHHLARNLERPESTVLFVGFQAEGTLGREILDGAPEVRVLGETRAVRADVRRIHGLSGHADRRQLLYWLEHFRVPPGRLFLTHGEESAALALAETIRDRFGWEATVPRYRETIEA